MIAAPLLEAHGRSKCQFRTLLECLSRELALIEVADTTDPNRDLVKVSRPVFMVKETVLCRIDFSR